MRWILLLLAFALAYREGQASLCCEHASSNYACHRTCQQLADLGHGNHHTQEIQYLADIVKNCPKDLSDFWRCVGVSYTALQDIERFYGRPCCDLAIMNSCRRSCVSAGSIADLMCRQSDELLFYSCIERQQKGDTCCAYATSLDCKLTCRALFVGETSPSREQKQSVNEHCSNDNPRVLACVTNSTQPTQVNRPEESLHCCDKAPSQSCKEICRRVLVSMETEQEIVETLIDECQSPVNPIDPMWQCFLSKSVDNDVKQVKESVIDDTGIDSAKLQCCAKATLKSCRDLCIESYGKRWSDTYNSFFTQCLRQQVEQEMMMCIAEVDEPCTQGCSGLDYCSNFNHRPTELFRSCNRRADQVAQTNVDSWKTGLITLPQAHLSIPLKDITRCKPEMWKAISCALQIKPCRSGSHASTVCRSDCLEMIHTCVDQSRLRGQTPEGICNMISPVDNSSECISLAKYLAPSPHIPVHQEVTSLCHPNPCNKSQVCQVNRRKCKHPDRCKPYVCKPACPMGEVSTLYVPRNMYVHVPDPSRKTNCFKVCKCGHRGLLDQCQSLPCTKTMICLMGEQKKEIKEHGSIFTSECNKCACVSGEMVCTQKHCLSPWASLATKQNYTGLPCNCDIQYVPVCGANGKTYPSSCVAKCLGLRDSQIQPGACSKQNPCANNPCAAEEVCVPRKKESMSSHQAVVQYDCVSTTVCSHHKHDPVCDTEGREHTNLCLLLQQGKKLAYWGHCTNSCVVHGEVCGSNGETYVHECAAWGERVTVDYPGPCITTGHLTTEAMTSGPSCDLVTCPVLPPRCVGVTPPGGCCPQCASEIRVLYSTAMVDRSADHIEPITVQTVTEHLRHHVTILECDVFGYLSIEGDLVILIKAITKSPTPLQVQACNTEAEKIASLIQLKSPCIMSDLVLSPLITADIRGAQIQTLNSAANQIPSLHLLLLTSLVVALVSRATDCS
ncbi:reversion-inducing cysteine-rich protein with Kazal motifs [Lingula anatina]|uniref:Reversion-inducing cysteine-rich protein with Kazal motifs n=1 Tax=Lingula anatina TaxID=7574 RepID=A0A1S3HGF1_LINAN|nr:reversion-inducing cysteine-rich protein with Kazal motifs [Lingula anatina]|eukprot:XP_013384099.1 reversion-inducing cysteine-rich protein with Kazal motifs [Lingula anatina]